MGKSRTENPEEVAGAVNDEARVKAEQERAIERLKAEKLQLEAKIAAEKARDEMVRKEAETEQMKIAASQKMAREKMLNTPLTAEERGHYERLEILANSGATVPSQSMLTLRDYRLRLANQGKKKE